MMDQLLNLFLFVENSMLLMQSEAQRNLKMRNLIVNNLLN